MVNTKINLCGTEIDNPVIPASGTFGFGYEFAALYDINVLGTFSFKGTTLNPRFGNPTPRIAECPSGMLNAVGLQNPGVDKVISQELPKLFKVFNKPVMANVSGFSLDEYRSRFGEDFICARAAKIKRYESLGLVRVENERISLTEDGFYLSNTIMADII